MFSVLMSLYDKESIQNFEESFNSIVNQTLMPPEVVLVLDGELNTKLMQSVDKFQKRYDFLKIVDIKQNVGLGKALNEGLKYTSYDIVARMDTDDIAKEDRFYKQLSFLHDNPGISVVGSWVEEFISETKEIKGIRKVPEKNSDIVVFSKKRNPLNHPSVMFRKKDVLECGGYIDFFLYEDYYLWIRMIKNQKKIHNIQESLLLFRADSMIKRRSGVKYLLSEVKFFLVVKKIGYINIVELLQILIVRITVRLLPFYFKKKIYHKLRS